ncbi:hypothetical protein Dsin_030379 [Dipteronia sinensis]|uniref:Uncharacterized protein n=1 Tax=Dipteronia sinensis TaxID=43782 RepID=A0AAE0DR26_9ROSI|nr:hypothetical protein Dsin_030379 [Dipteronia sinensis]
MHSELCQAECGNGTLISYMLTLCRENVIFDWCSRVKYDGDLYLIDSVALNYLWLVLCTIIGGRCSLFSLPSLETGEEVNLCSSYVYGFPPFHKLMNFCEDKCCLRIAVLKDDIKEFKKNANTDGFLRLDYYYFRKYWHILVAVIMYVLLPMPLLFFVGSDSSLLSESDNSWVNVTKFLTGGIGSWKHCYTRYLEACRGNWLGGTADGALVLFHIGTVHCVLHWHGR